MINLTKFTIVIQHAQWGLLNSVRKNIHIAESIVEKYFLGINIIKISAKHAWILICARIHANIQAQGAMHAVIQSIFSASTQVNAFIQISFVTNIHSVQMAKMKTL